VRDVPVAEFAGALAQEIADRAVPEVGVAAGSDGA